MTSSTAPSVFPGWGGGEKDHTAPSPPIAHPRSRGPRKEIQQLTGPQTEGKIRTMMLGVCGPSSFPVELSIVSYPLLLSGTTPQPWVTGKDGWKMNKKSNLKNKTSPS